MTKKAPTAASDRTTHSFDENQVFAQVSPISLCGQSLFEAGIVAPSNVSNYYSDPSITMEARRRLEQKGFKTGPGNNVTFSVQGDRSLFEKVFGQKLVVKRVNILESISEDGVFVPHYFTESEDKILKPPADLADVIEGISLPTPHQYMESALPPSVGYHHLDVPADVSMLLNADKAHRLGITGACIRVAMVDSGQYLHPFFTSRGYNVDPVVLSPDSAASNPLDDLIGHGTMESANIFAAAPDARLIPIKTNLQDTAAAFTTALNQNPDIITNSWGRSLSTPPYNALPPEELPLAAAIAEAINRGIIVCFSAGNGHIAWPAMHPDVIAVGGVFADENGDLQASDYASSFTTPIFPHRNVPDVCGLVGMRPAGIYIMLPGQPGCDIDTIFAGAAFPNRDETAPDDGWACLSGTSASSPQIAGICALLRQLCKDLTSPQARQILMSTARDIITGNTHPSADQPPGLHSAVPGVDLATGHGLADAAAAVLAAQARCRCECGCGSNQKPCKEDKRKSRKRFTYAVKFACGNAKAGIVAKGQYFTAINIQNPSDKTVRFRKHISVALPGERAGMVTERTFTKLGPYEALEIDCPDIYKYVGLPDGCFLKGFVNIESVVELDIVAVYSASGADGHVESIHTERVSGRVLEFKRSKTPERIPEELPDLIPVPPYPAFPAVFPHLFCHSPQQVAVIVRNQGSGIAGQTTTSVEFETGDVIDVETEPLDAGEETLLFFPIPGGCFPETCSFTITVNADPADGVEESNVANNTVDANCSILS